MPYQTVRDAELYHEDTGQGEETIVFSHGLLMTHAMFDAQVEILRDSYRCVRFDHRGQGRSTVTGTGYDMDSLCEDAAGLIRQLDCGPVHFVGLSMGGFVGLRLAIRHPGLLRSLTLIGTSADPEPARSRLKFKFMRACARRFGFRLLAGRILPLMFGRTFLHDPKGRAQADQWRTDLLAADREGILLAAGGVIDRGGVHDRLGSIGVPALILVGEEDRTTPLSRARRIHSVIPLSRLAVIPGAGHSLTMEQPEAVTAAMLDFFVGISADRRTA